MKERILAYCQMKGITPNAFETKAGWSPSTIYNLKKGVRSDKLADAALAFPDLNIRWLLTGEGAPVYEISYTTPKENNGTDKHPSHFTSPTNVIRDNNVVIIGNWSELGDVVEKAVLKAMSNK